MWWEKFLAKYPQSVVAGEAREKQTIYQRVLLLGMDNSPVFDYETGRLTHAYREAWQRLSEKYPDTDTGRLVNGYLQLLAANGYRDNARSQAYLKKNKISYDLGGEG